MMLGMSTRRTYGDSCGIARALDVVGERWGVLIVRELMFGPKRFTDLRDGLPGVSADILAQRLRELEEAGIVQRDKLPPPSGARVYSLTDRGAELEPVLIALGRWGSQVPLPPAPADLSPDALAVALKTMYRPGRARRTYQLGLGEHRFCIRCEGTAIEIDRAPAAEVQLRIDTDPATLTELLWHGGNLDEAAEAGRISIDGPRREADRFLALFRL
jgi:DNA-binding HxlR family transcriptional regulator